MIENRRGKRWGGVLAALCISAALVSCSSAYSTQENLVKAFLTAASNHDAGKAVTLMPRLSLLSPEQQRLALDDLSRIGRYEISGTARDGDAVIVTLRYSQGGQAVSLSIPVLKEGDSWIIGDEFRLRRSLDGVTIPRKD